MWIKIGSEADPRGIPYIYNTLEIWLYFCHTRLRNGVHYFFSLFGFSDSRLMRQGIAKFFNKMFTLCGMEGNGHFPVGYAL